MHTVACGQRWTWIIRRPLGRERGAQPRHPRLMITRLWRGWTAAEHADAYERFLLEELFPSMGVIAGFLGAEVLRRRETRSRS
jgi:hypothetical protein